MSLADKMKMQMVKSVLPSLVEMLPQVEEYISAYIKEQTLQDGEKRAVVTVYNKENSGLSIALAAVDTNDTPVRIIQQSGLVDFIKQLISNIN